MLDVSSGPLSLSLHLGDVSPKGLRQAHGLMVNYRYDLDAIEKNHEAFVNHGTVIAGSAVTRALRTDLPTRSPAAAEEARAG